MRVVLIKLSLNELIKCSKMQDINLFKHRGFEKIIPQCLDF